MALIYKFKKERLEDGQYASRPIISISLRGKDTLWDFFALIDTGCDTTVIPEGIARQLGLDMDGKISKLYAHRESTDVIQSKATITFEGKAKRISKTIRVPVLISLSKKSIEDEGEIVLGINGIFDEFKITFNKPENKIIFKEASRSKFSIFKYK